jgi:predicted ATP-grasp superfamily ATP-dependent carboligase
LISDDGRFRYVGGEAPLDEARSQRAQALALAAIGCLPPAIGYVGVALVLGAASDGSADVVIEVNPRLTTSYLGLRRLLSTNLAAAMLSVADGSTVELRLARSHVRFE